MEAIMESPDLAHDKTSKIVSKYLKGKDQQWKALYERKRPLTLLELPVDILRLIVKEITHTNDLTALALTNSALHNLAVPLIYSRFDIVWPDGHMASSESKSVDALTYGLSTLCLGSAFARTTTRLFNPDAPPLEKFKGNEYAKYTKKFSLGNGPNDWVAEYMINKESGKMLGTLVALAVAKMKNLEAFVWDMPTGVLSDIFMALSSLADQNDHECKLNRVWIRWHDNADGLITANSVSANPIGSQAVVPLGSQLTPVGIMLPANASHPAPRPAISYSEHHCEYPTFSVLPSLKSLSVLDIDELDYLDEMAVLLERSKDTLQELRVGISAKASHKDFVQTWDGPGLKQIDHRARWPGESTIGERRLGGVLGVLVGKVYDIRKRNPSRGKDRSPPEFITEPEVSSAPVSPVSPTPTPDLPAPIAAGATDGPEGEAYDVSLTNGHMTAPSLSVIPEGQQPAPTGGPTSQRDIPTKAQSSPKANGSSKSNPPPRRRLEGKLKLQTLELERVPLSMQVCRHAIDWSILSSITLLECAQHENLWKMLRKQFQPTPMSSGFGISSTSRAGFNAPLQYHLALKHIHTDITTTALINFVKETLAPNTLEVLFLQDRRRGSGPPPVTLDAIYKGPLKRHRLSLRKLLLDSSAKPAVTGGTAAGDNVRWRNWVLTSEIMHYVTSGRMSNLRELAVSLDYRDWHTFLQRLPNIPHLRSINVPHIDNYISATFEPREQAMQIINIITLRPEIRLCYVGLGSKCFEILESRETGRDSESRTSSPDGLGPSNTASLSLNGTSTTVILGLDAEPADDQEETSEDDDDDEEEENDSDDENTPTTATSDPDETQSENGVQGVGSDDDDDESFLEADRGRIKLRLREILFYDDKVAIFKARHAKL
ncbi:hypothetical protein QBC46DRAFT_153068 [Diplogelasinospora grovesii]|uniref:F-box domain-containing protein n=1 Tax=Diplogelasinospora grovesii TaxID=303347 RepID=A0AAN6S3I6_9PEZI|nr:hypothetical protein QBC46DRAFT_153068 [Diplogelasinospora grovesii]